MKMMQLFRGQDGNAMIELAVILPLLILMLLGMVDFGIIVNQDLRLADAARAAALGAMVRSYATNTAVVTALGAVAGSGIPGFNITSSQYCTCANGVGTASCTNHASCGAYGIPNQYIKVTATATLPLIFGLTGLPASISVQSVAIARTAWTGTQ